MVTTARPAYPIESVDRALTLVLEFQVRDSISVSEASTLLGVSRSTAYRLLNVLEHREFVRQDPRSRMFHGGPALLRVGLAAVQRTDVRRRFRPLLERLVAEVDETAHLVVLQRGDAFFLDCVEGTMMVRATPRTGAALPAHCSSGGKVLLAAQRDAVVEEVLAAGPLAALTPRSKGTADAVRAELADVRRRGWAVNDGESEVGLRAVGIAIPHAERECGTAAAVTVSGPAARLDDRRMVEIVTALRRAVAEDA